MVDKASEMSHGSEKVNTWNDGGDTVADALDNAGAFVPENAGESRRSGAAASDEQISVAKSS